MGFVLSCSERDTALTTLSEGYGCTVSELENVLAGIDLEEVFKAGPYIPITANQLLFEHTGSLPGEHDEVTLAVWFNGTRTAANNQFLEGILPLNFAFPAVHNP